MRHDSSAFVFVAILGFSDLLGTTLGLNMADVPCGTTPSGSRRTFQRIMGGSVAEISDFPYTVSIKKHGQHHCGGSLISDRFVVTAAHCVKGYAYGIFSITVGEQHKAIIEEHEKNFTVENIIIHPDFQISKYIHDIALIQLNEAVIWNDHVQPVCLPDSENDDFSGQQGLLAGWGYDMEERRGGKLTDELRYAKLPILSHATCQAKFDKFNEENGKRLRIIDEQVCAGHDEGMIDGCQGDSGGPLVAQKADKNLVLIGLMSSGVGCGRPNLPAIYTRVPAYIKWIVETVSSSNDRAPKRIKRQDWTGMVVSDRIAMLKKDIEATFPLARIPSGLPMRSLSY